MTYRVLLQCTRQRDEIYYIQATNVIDAWNKLRDELELHSVDMDIFHHITISQDFSNVLI